MPVSAVILRCPNCGVTSPAFLLFWQNEAGKRKHTKPNLPPLCDLPSDTGTVGRILIFFQFFILFVTKIITNKEEEGNLLLCVSVNNIRELISSAGGMWEKELMLLCVNQGKQEVRERGCDETKLLWKRTLQPWLCTHTLSQGQRQYAKNSSVCVQISWHTHKDLIGLYWYPLYIGTLRCRLTQACPLHLLCVRKGWR